MAKRLTSYGDPNTDPLWRYKDMMSVSDLADFFNLSYDAARAIMEKLPHVNVGAGKTNRCMRVHKQYVREKYNLPDPRTRHIRFARSP